MEVVEQEQVLETEREEEIETEEETPAGADVADESRPRLDSIVESVLFCAGAPLALRRMVADLKQVRAYLTDQRTHEQVRDRVATRIGPDTRVVVAHSLGSVVAYEALCSLPGHGVRALVTRGTIARGARVVAVLTGHVLKDPGMLLGYHVETEPPPPGANRPIEIEPHLQEVERALNRGA